MSLFAYLNGVLVGTSSIRLNAQGRQGIVSLPTAADGTGSQGGIVFDDPSGALTVTGWQIVKVTEPDCASAPVLFYGTVADREYRRGPYSTGAGREIDTTLNDHNGFLSLRILGGNGPSRPEETDIARLAWLLTDASLDGLVYDLGFVNGTGLTFDATNLQGMYPAEVLADLASRYGQIYFTYWDQAAQKVGLFFDFPTATTFTSTLSISNVASDITRDANGIVTGSVYPPLIDGSLVADPSEVYSRVRFKYTGGVVWRSDATTAATFFPEPLRYRSLQVENDRVGKESTAITFAERILAADDEERFTLKFTVRLPSTKIGLLQAGMRIQCRFTHLPGFDPAAYTRIERLIVVPTDGDPTQYDATVECSTYGLTSATGSGGGSTDPFPYVPPSAASIVQQIGGYNTFVMPSGNVAAGDTLVFIGTSRGAIPWGYGAFGYTLVLDQAMGGGANRAFCVYKQATGSEGDTLNTAYDDVSGVWFELPGEWTPDTSAVGFGAGSPTSTGPITAASGSITFTSTAYGQGGAYDSGASGFLTTPGTGWTEDYDSYTRSGGAPTAWVAHRTDAGSLTATSSNSAAGGAADGFGAGTTNWAGVIVSFTSTTPTSDPPTSGKAWGPVLPTQTPNGSIVSFSMPTGYTWAVGSLRVWVDNLDQTAAVTAEDGAAGTFTLGFAPKTGELVQVYGVAI